MVKGLGDKTLFGGNILGNKSSPSDSGGGLLNIEGKIKAGVEKWAKELRMYLDPQFRNINEKLDRVLREIKELKKQEE